MPQVDLVDVRIVVDGQPLQEYPSPENVAAADDGASLHFVEAVAGQEFSVKVTWLAGFETHEAPYLYYDLELDDREKGWYDACTYKKTQVHGGSLVQEVSSELGESMYKDHQGQWKVFFFSFGALDISERLVLMKSRE